MAIEVQTADGEPVLSNRRAEELLDGSGMLTAGDREGWTVHGIDGEPLEPGELPTAAVRESGDPVFDREIAVVEPDGERTWLSVNAAPVYDVDGELDRIVTAAEDITEVKRRTSRLEQRRDELESELAEIFERVDDAFYALDEQWRFTYLNERAEALLDRAEDELLGETLWEAFPETDEVDEIRTTFREAMAENEPRELEVYSAALGFWVEVHLYPSQSGLSVYFRDVTERKEHEKELERYETIVETVGEGVYTVDSDGRFTMVNEAYAEMTGYDREELLGAHVSTVVEEDTVEMASEVESELVAGERQSATFEADVLTADGGTLRAEGTFTILPGDDETFERAGVVRDITERVQRERELERALDLLEQAERIADVGGWEIDPETMSVFWSDHLFEILRIEGEEEPPIEEALDVYHEDDRQRVAAAVEAAIESGEPIDVEARLSRPDGEMRWLRILGQAEVADGDVVTVRGAAQDITDHKEHERELAEYRRIVETVDDGVYVLDGEQEFARVNSAFVDMTASDREELLGTHASAVFGDDFERIDLDTREDAEAGQGGVTAVEEELHTAAGETITIDNRFQLYDLGEEWGRVGVVRDITERKEYERELHRFEALIEESTDVNAIIDDDGTFEYVTPSADHVLGYPADELAGEDAFSYLHPDDREEVAAALESIVAGDRERETKEFRFRHADGSWVWLEARGRNLRDDPSIGGVVVYTRDVTERKAHEATLETRANQQAVISELGHDALKNPELPELLAEATRAITRTLGADYVGVLELDADAGALTLREGVGWDEGLVGSATVSADEDLQTGYTLISEAPVVVSDLVEEARFAATSLQVDHGVRSGITTMIGSRDDPWGVLGVYDTDPESFSSEDVDFVQSVGNVLATAIERQAYEEELEALIEELEESNERLERFAYIASHDLQEPLRMVSSYLSLIEDRYADELDGDGREFIDFAVDGADRMRAMIDDLLAYSRVDTEAEPFEPTDCEAVVDRVRSNLEVQIEESDATVEVGSLPTVTADANQLEQVFQNLISNAIKYHEDEPPEVEIDAHRDAGEWIFTVSDNGIGMDPEQTDRIFDVFQRLHTNDEYVGTGIGLALCEKIVERHGGDIWVESEPGAGSTFYFTLSTSSGDRGGKLHSLASSPEVTDDR